MDMSRFGQSRSARRVSASDKTSDFSSSSPTGSMFCMKMSTMRASRAASGALSSGGTASRSSSSRMWASIIFLSTPIVWESARENRSSSSRSPISPPHVLKTLAQARTRNGCAATLRRSALVAMRCSCRTRSREMPIPILTESSVYLSPSSKPNRSLITRMSRGAGSVASVSFIVETNSS